MRKKAFLIPTCRPFVWLVLTLIGAFVLRGAIAWANSAQVSSDSALTAQKQLILEAIAQKDQEKADAEIDSMIQKFYRNKNTAEAIYNVARSYSRLDREKAIQIHSDNISIYPESVFSMWSQVEIFTHHFYAGDSKAAEEDVNTLINTFGSQPTIAKELYQIACKYNQAGKRTKAKELYALAAQFSPDDLYVQLSKLFTDSESKEAAFLFTEMVEKQLRKESLGPDDAKLAKEIYNAAVHLGYAGEHENAINCYRHVIDTWPDSSQAPYALQRMAIEYSKLGDEYNAGQAINKLIEEYNDFPKKAETFWKLGQYYREEANMYAQAAEYYEYAANNCTKDDNYTMFSQVELVKYYIRSGDIATGDQQFDKLMSEFASNSKLASNICFIGDTYLRAGEIDTAQSLYNDVLKKWPNDAQTIFAVAGQAKVAVSLGQDTKAMKIVDEILAEYSDNPNIGTVIFDIGEEYWNKALIERSKNPRKDLTDTTKEYFAQARNVWGKIIQELSSSYQVREAYHYIAESYRSTGDDENAIEYYQIVVDNWPDYQYAAHCQFMVAKHYESLRISGKIPEEVANHKIKEAYENLLKNYPDCIPAWITRERLNYYDSKISPQKE